MVYPIRTYVAVLQTKKLDINETELDAAERFLEDVHLGLMNGDIRISLSGAAEW